MTISIGDGRVFFADDAVTEQQREQTLKDRIARMQQLTGVERMEAEEKLKAATVRLVTALDAATGEKLWERPVDLTDCGTLVSEMRRSTLVSMHKGGILLFFGVYGNGHDYVWRAFFAGQHASRRVVALSATNGSGRTLYRTPRLC